MSDLVQELGNFYTEVYRDDEEAEYESEVDRRPFTRPFAQHHTGTMLNDFCHRAPDDRLAQHVPVSLVNGQINDGIQTNFFCFLSLFVADSIQKPKMEGKS